MNKWDIKYKSYPNTIPEPAQVLKDNSHLLPKEGVALDLACGLGGNALFLARKGFSTHAWDISSVALKKLDKISQQQFLQITSKVTDVLITPPEANTYDVIIVSYFLERAINKYIYNALKPNGLLYYQTFTAAKTGNLGPTNPDYLLQKGELLSIFNKLQLLVYREENLQGDTKKGLRNEALFIGKKI